MHLYHSIKYVHRSRNNYLFISVQNLNFLLIYKQVFYIEGKCHHFICRSLARIRIIGFGYQAIW